MLISKVPENDGGQGEGIEVPDEESDAHEYHTANELFELMAKNQNFDNNSDVDKLTTRDLVILYKNIDLGTKLMSNANDPKHQRPNQHVETIVYNDEPESDSSEVGDIYSNENLHDMYLVNKERIDLLNTPSSVENTLCHKLGDLEIQSANLTTEYDKHILIQDTIKEQLRRLKLMTNSTHNERTVLPASLLDFICCKNLEDNYNFYMDNIIRYVKHTIEQLKRISNGDYLTDKAKEKWREVENIVQDPRHINAKVLTTSTSIPLQVECKIGGQKSTWDDIVHSAVDIRSISKILEKKIVVEVPKLICGSYTLMSQFCAENLVIRCQKERTFEETNEESRVDVVFQLQRSKTGQFMSNISSIMILHTAPVVFATQGSEVAPLPIQEATNELSSKRKVEIIELEQIDSIATIKDRSFNSESSDGTFEDTCLDGIDSRCSDENDDTASLKNSSYQESNKSSDALRDFLDKKVMFSKREASCDAFYEDLRMTMQKMTMQGALTEESGEDVSLSAAIKKNSPTRVRIKSPYENQSYIMEEKKRRRLLEIRERRERKKKALAENCKITKHRYGKGGTMPQSASSVTKLSISNKSFYNSIYGQSANMDSSKQTKERNRKGGKREALDSSQEGLEGENDVSVSSPGKNSKKYINRSYYLDDAVTEMMYMNMKRSENDGKELLCSTSTSVISNDFRNNLDLLSQLIAPSTTELNDDSDHHIKFSSATRSEKSNPGNSAKVLITSQSILNMVPPGSPNAKHDINDPKKVTSSLECRKSIDKVYTLIKKLRKSQVTEIKSSKINDVANNAKKGDVNGARESFMFQGSDSGTSLKHNLTSSNPSCFSFGKNNNEILKPSNTYNPKPGNLTRVVQKVIICSKSSSQTTKTESDKNKKGRKRLSPVAKIPENPLKAISQFLHDFENVHRNKQKAITEQKPTKKLELVSSDVKSGSRQDSLKRRSRLDQHNEAQTERNVRVTTPKDKKTKQYTVMDITKIPYQQIPVEDRHLEKIQKKKITDILDEAKEARGEAVRGPSKLNSRLNSLAQPKRSYVQAHSEEYQTKYGKTIMADRLQRLAAAPPPPAPDRITGALSSRNKVKRSGEAVSAVSMKLQPPPVPPLDRAVKTRHCTSASPDRKDKLTPGLGPSYHKPIIAPETPQTLKKKLVAVESYVKHRYRRVTSTTVITGPQSPQKSRVPFLPNDIELASSSSSTPAQESTELGSRLHHIVNTIMMTTTQGLEVLNECHESNSRISKEITDEDSLAETLSRSEHISSDSDYTIDILNDNNVLTSVESKINFDTGLNQKQDNAEAKDANQNDLNEIKHLKSITEVDELEHVLRNQISVGSFQKRLRIKNLTLTPKQSMQQLFMLQSGDASSLLVQTSMTQIIKEKKADNISDLKALPVLSKPHLEWNFANFPMQIAMVGYAFPEYKSIKCGSTSLVQLFDGLSKDSEKQTPLLETSNKSDNHSQCFKGGLSQVRLEPLDPVDVPAETLVTTGKDSTHFMKSHIKEEIKQCVKTDTEPNHVFLDYSENKPKEVSANSDQILTNALMEKKETASTTGKLDSIDYTTSLDMLVNLLNEIHKISTCQTQMTNTNKNDYENQQSQEFETILNKTATPENFVRSSVCDVLSLTSLDRLRQLDSHPSLYSFYLSDFEGSEMYNNKMNFPTEIFPFNSKELLYSKPIFADKEVSADILDVAHFNRYIDVTTSQSFPISISRSTNMTNSLRALGVPSPQSVVSFAKYHSVYPNTSTLCDKDIDIPQLMTKESNQSLGVFEVKQTIEKLNVKKLYKKKIKSFDKENIDNKNGKVTKGKFCLKTDIDPIMKMKRDILVTIYSILVFTIFAALSFPEMLYRVY